MSKVTFRTLDVDRGFVLETDLSLARGIAAHEKRSVAVLAGRDQRTRCLLPICVPFPPTMDPTRPLGPRSSPNAARPWSIYPHVSGERLEQLHARYLRRPPDSE